MPVSGSNSYQLLAESETVPFAFRAYAIYEVDKPLTDKELHKLIDRLILQGKTVRFFSASDKLFFWVSLVKGSLSSTEKYNTGGLTYSEATASASYSSSSSSEAEPMIPLLYPTSVPAGQLSNVPSSFPTVTDLLELKLFLPPVFRVN